MARTIRSAAAAALLWTAAAAAQNLSIGFDSEWTSTDPHFHNFPQNLSLAHQVFEPLVQARPDSSLEPRLALSWRAIDPLTWEFRLRPGVRFHDGAEFTAADVAATIERIPRVPNSPGSLVQSIRAIASTEVRDPMTVVFRLKQPEPILPQLLTDIYIVSSGQKNASTDDFNQGRAMNGTGPYRFVRWSRGDRAVFVRSDTWWGGRAPWAQVEVRVLTNVAAREAALLSREVDLIQNPSTLSLERLRADARLALFQAPSTRITYLQFDQGPSAKADVKGTDGRNPFADPRVRRAVSLAIPRQLIAERVMDGLALPAGQLVAPGHPGHVPGIAVDRPDPERARQLLREAGWPNGFEFTISTPSDRNVNGVKVTEAIAAALNRIGLRTQVNAVPLNVWLTEWRKGQYGAILHGAGPPPATVLLPGQMAGTKDPKRALGSSNESGYSNPTLDDAVTRLAAELDPGRRSELLASAARIVHDEVAVVPLHHEIVVWAARGGLQFVPRADARTWAISVTPQ